MSGILSFLAAHPIAYLLVAVLLFALAYAAWRRSVGGPASRSIVARPEIREHAEAAAAREKDAREPARPIRPASLPGGGDGGKPPAGARLDSEVAQLDTRVSSLDEALSGRMDRLEKRIAALEEQLEAPADGNGGGPPPPPPPPPLYDDARHGAASLRWSDRGPASPDAVVSQPIGGYASPPRGRQDDPGGERVPVEIKDGEVVVSHSYPPEAWLVPQAGGRAALSVNSEVPLTGFALDRFARFFDLGDRREGSYVTSQAAEVRWDGQRGSAIRPGKAAAR